ncbi:ABC transporter permease [Lichenifustis flavocetrariae]|uniref:ABC transporter permease n=1 Tax=Lichenifustis flavocetrariae TaxID=2949735 RepID=A0AA42CND8_9HYPH|nr:ABC transporter permease [Lichenifustis flavocetrariae]MCW6509275.1 ABC transporter permease [Lichenifustis flavocetrariae]
MPLAATWHRLPRFVRIILTRLGMIVPQMLGVTLVTFLLVRLLPGDPARLILGNFATDDSIKALKQHLGLDQSLPVQMERYLIAVLHGDLGMSPFTSNPVLTDLAQRAPATLELIGYAMILTVIAAVSLAVISVVRPGGIVDVVARIYGLVAGAIPDFWVALLLVFFLFHILGWAPAPFGRIDAMINAPPTITGFLTIDSVIAGDRTAFWSAASRLVLPVLTIAIVNTGALMKMAQTSFRGAYQSEFVNHMRLCGVPERRIIRSALRNALPPIISQTSFITGFLLGAAVLVETIFAWGGLGQYAVQAVVNSDYAAIQGFVLVASAFVLVVYSVADILYELADPRIQV